jgi:hypothetical protein
MIASFPNDAKGLMIALKSAKSWHKELRHSRIPNDSPNKMQFCIEA